MKSLIILVLSFLPITLTLADNGHDHEDDNTAEDTLTLTAAAQAEAGIHISQASSGVIRQGIKVYGYIRLANNNQSHIRARFPGTVKALYVSLGETVSKGQKLAVIEANESLQRYSVTAPIAGLINESHANLGEFVNEQRLFSIINTQEKWAELQLFPSQFASIKPGLNVVINSQNKQVAATINNIIMDQEQGLYIARAKLDPSDFAIATPVNATIYTQEKPVSLRVEKQAIQTLEGKTHLFIQHDDNFIAKPVTLGIADKEYVQILEGIEPGEKYVSQGSYLLKADLLKNGAAHQH